MNAKPLPAVAIVIVNWNGYTETAECLKSLTSIDYTNFSVIIVDNDSTDGSESKLRTQYPQHLILQAGSNIGFAGGANLGIRYAIERQANYVLLLNNDAKVSHGFLKKMVDLAEADERIGVVGGKINTSSGDVVWACGGKFNVNTGSAKHFASAREFESTASKPPWHAYIPGCLILVKQKCIEDVGLFSERYFHLGEDVDYCLRVHNQGWKFGLVSDVCAFHKGSASLARFSPLYNYYEQRNRLFLIRKYRTDIKSFFSTVRDPLTISARLLVALLRVNDSRNLFLNARLVSRSVRDFFLNRDGKIENDFGHHAAPSVSERGPCGREGDL